MQESSVYQDITQRARAEGRKEFAIESILELLEVRFQTTPATVKSALEAIDDTQRLKELYREAAETETLTAFTDKL